MVTRVLNVGRRLKAKAKVNVSAIAAITQESSANNLPHGHGSSVGLFQMIDTHGSFERRHNPEWAARWYFIQAINVNYWKPWYTPAEIAQAVERSAYPAAYRAWVSEAWRSYGLYLKSCKRVA